MKCAIFLVLPVAYILSGCLGWGKKEESWNSYYYGGYHEMNGKFSYSSDNDEHYVPYTGSFGGRGQGAPLARIPTLYEERPLSKNIDGHDK